MKKFYLLFLLPAVVLSACKKEDNTPSWLIINDFVLTTDEPTEGANSHNITDAWVYLGTEPIGVFELPAKVPILADGLQEFTIYPGIIKNGISSTRGRYPFYEAFKTTATLTRGAETEITPTTTYKSNVNFQMIEDFESVGVQFEKGAISDTSIQIITDAMYPDIVEYGNSCGAVYLTSTDSVFKGVTNTNLLLPQGEEVYMEVDFRTDNSMVMGLIPENSGGSQEQTPYVGFNPKEGFETEWRKLYIDLKENVSFEINATSFEIYLLSILDDGNTQANIYLDNIKVVRYE